MTKSELKKLTYRDKFSNYLPYLAYDRARKLYVNTDDTIGWIWECAPLAFASQQTINILSGLFRLGMPPGAIVQFTLYADEYIEPYLNSYLSLKTREDDIVKQASLSYAKFLFEGRKGMKQLSNVPLRNYRLFCSVKMPTETKTPINYDDTYNTIAELLKGASLYPRPLEPEALLSMLRRFFNNVDQHEEHTLANYDESVPLRKQVIFAETEIQKEMSRLVIGDKSMRCTTAKNFPRDVDAMQTNELFGGIMGIVDDTNQIPTPFLYTLNIIFHPLKQYLHAKCNLVIQQQGVGSFAPSLQRKKDEYLWAVDELERGTPFVQIIPTFWTWHENEKTSSEAIARVKRLWETKGYVMQEDKGILPILLVSSLPFGLYDKGNNVEMLDRDFIAPDSAVAPCLPVQADFAGGGDPYLLLIGRKGQLCSLNLFDKSCNNNNVFVAAESGSGKSFLVNFLVFNYYAANALIRIIDIGGSYRKMSYMFNARYLDFDENSVICLNPFTNVRDISEELPVITALVMQMIYSATDEVPKEIAESSNTLVKMAVKWAYDTKRNGANIDDVHYYLAHYPLEETASGSASDMLRVIAHTMAVNLKDFTSDGMYGRWFNGPCTFDIGNDDFVVLELEHLKPKKELFKVVTLQIINAVTADLYLSDRSQRRFIIFDEAWQFLKDGSSLKDVIEEGYRRARKYGGSFTVVTQSILDLKKFGAVGDVIRANSAFKFYLESKDIEKAVNENLLEVDGFVQMLLKSVKSNRPKYSEIFVECPFGSGVMRLTVDNYSYYVYTSDAKEIAEIEGMVKEGIPYADAINEMIRKYRS